MLDRLFGMLGYVPASTASFVTDGLTHESAAPGSPLPPHREAAAAFDFTAADQDDLCFWYREEGDTYRYAIGRDGFAPLAVVGFSLVANARFSDVLNHEIRSRLWLGTRTEMISSWRAANMTVLTSLGQRLDDAFRPLSPPTQSGNLELEVVPFIGAAEMASMFAMTWQRARIESPVFFLSNSEAYGTLVSHHAFRSAVMASDHALERVLEWLVVWLESRGLEVDRKTKLVRFPEYQALLYRADQRI